MPAYTVMEAIGAVNATGLVPSVGSNPTAGTMSKRALVIPDVQAGPGRSLKHLEWCANFISDKQFDIIIQIGDLGDFTSSSSYDRGKASAENRRFSKDWDAFRTAADLIMGKWPNNYRPRLVYTEGNHEYRITRYANDNPEIDTLPSPTAYMESLGWEAFPFLQVARVEGCNVSHFFPRTLTGAITSTSMKYGAANARNMVRANMASCIAGHKPGLDWDVVSAGNRNYHGLIAGSFYTHNEDFMGPQQRYWRGVVVLNQLRNGEFDPCPVSINYLKERYG